MVIFVGLSLDLRYFGDFDPDLRWTEDEENLDGDGCGGSSSLAEAGGSNVWSSFLLVFL